MDKNKTTSLSLDNTHFNSFGAVSEPIVLSSTFLRDKNGEFPSGRDIYSRTSNPNRTSLEKKLAALENGSDAACFASGQAASMAIFHSLGTGSHVIIPDDIYFGTRVLLEKLFSNWGLSFSSIDMTNFELLKNSIRPNTKLIWIETPSNPQLKITDISEVVKIAKANNVLTACDNTWATPFFTNPFDFGVDIIMHSTTKYLGGHSDLIGGVVIVSENTPISVFSKIKDFQTLGGAVPSPQDCWLLSRSLATFTARMPIHSKNALFLAEYLETHPSIEKVFYPGLKNNLYFEIAKRQMKNGFGGMLSVLVKGSEKDCLAVASNLKVFRHATSLGGVESLVDHRKTAEGIHSLSPNNLLRISVGIEDFQDLMEDFRQALASY